jgi:hypothetical protein
VVVDISMKFRINERKEGLIWGKKVYLSQGEGGRIKLRNF